MLLYQFIKYLFKNIKGFSICGYLDRVFLGMEKKGM